MPVLPIAMQNENSLLVILIASMIIAVFRGVVVWRKTPDMPNESKHITLSGYKWFRLALEIPLIISAGIALVILIKEAEVDRICYTGECFYNLYVIYRAPLLLAGLSLALSGIVAAVHRSNETAKQIRIAQDQYDLTLTKNNFENYLKHREIFITSLVEKLLNTLNENRSSPTMQVLIGDKGAIDIDANKLYRILFPNNSMSRFSSVTACKLAINDIEKIESNCEELYFKLKKLKTYEHADACVQLESEYDLLYEKLCVKSELFYHFDFDFKRNITSALISHINSSFA